MASRSGSVSGKALGQNSAGIFRKCSASRFRSEEEEAGLHLVVRVWNDKKRNRFYSFFSYDQKWSSESNYPRFPFPKKSSYIIGSCNGLLCFEILSDSSGFHKCFIWEPSSNKLQLIPQADSMKRPCEYSSSKHDCITHVLIGGSGLFFDSGSGDYKLFCFTTNYQCSDSPTFVQFYSVKNNAWKELSYPLFNDQEIKGDGKGICVNGVCYWTAYCANDFSFMLSFNFATEEFSSFHGPKLDSDEAYELVELDGSLGVLIHPLERRRKEGVISLMVYSPSPSPSPSWSRVDGFDDVPVVGFHEPLWFGKRNDSYYLLLKGPQGVLLEYDYTRKVFNQIHKMPAGPVDDCYAFAYETKTTTKNNADIWHSSSFHEVEVQKRFAVYATHQTGDDY